MTNSDQSPGFSGYTNLQRRQPAPHQAVQHPALIANLPDRRNIGHRIEVRRAAPIEHPDLFQAVVRPDKGVGVHLRDRREASRHFGVVRVARFGQDLVPQQIALALEHLFEAMPAVEALRVGARRLAGLGQIQFHSLRIHKQEMAVRLREILEHRQRGRPARLAPPPLTTSCPPIGPSRSGSLSLPNPPSPSRTRKC